MTTNEYRYEGEITNQCVCTTFNEETADWEPRAECYGYCWEDQEEDFANMISDFLLSTPTNEFDIADLPLWDRKVSGRFTAKNAREFLAAVTVRGAWNLSYEVTPQAFVARLAHHDVPMGGTLRVTPITGEVTK